MLYLNRVLSELYYVSISFIILTFFFHFIHSCFIQNVLFWFRFLAFDFWRDTNNNQTVSSSSFYRCISAFAEYRKRLESEFSDQSLVDHIRPVEETLPEKFDPMKEVNLQSSSSRRAETAHQRFDKRKRTLWLTLMTHEDSLSRKITV